MIVSHSQLATTTRLKIFLSHPSSAAPAVREVDMALRTEGHTVFFDETDLPAGEGYHDKIRQAIRDCDLFIFFITPDSVAAGKYTLTELKIATDRWENPVDRILSVMLEKTPFASIPAAARAVTLLTPVGNVAAEVAMAVETIAHRSPAAVVDAGPAPPTHKAPTYRRLKLRFQPAENGEYPVEVPEAPSAERPRAALHLDPSDLESRLWASPSRVVDARSGLAAELPSLDSVRGVGAALYDALFASGLRGYLEQSLRQVRPQTGEGLRFLIDATDTPEVAGLPWEFAYDRKTEDFVFRAIQMPIVRWLDLEQAPPTLEVEPPLRLLIAVASPADQPGLRVGEELSRLNAELAQVTAAHPITTVALEHASLNSLDRALVDHAPHILHFIGHGGFAGDEGLVYLESDARPGTTQPLDGSRLSALLRNHLQSLRLVFLNSCLGAAVSRRDPFGGLAQRLIRRGVPAVVAMQFPIPDRAAILLAQDFYRYVAAGFPVDAALTSARTFLYVNGFEVEWGAPVLHMQAPDGRLFHILGSAAPAAAAEVARATPVAFSTPDVRPAPPPAASPPIAQPAAPPRRARPRSARRPLITGLAAAVLVLAVLAVFRFGLGSRVRRGNPGSASLPSSGAHGARHPGNRAIVPAIAAGRPLSRPSRAGRGRGHRSRGVHGGLLRRGPRAGRRRSFRAGPARVPRRALLGRAPQRGGVARLRRPADRSGPLRRRRRRLGGGRRSPAVARSPDPDRRAGGPARRRRRRAERAVAEARRGRRAAAGAGAAGGGPGRAPRFGRGPARPARGRGRRQSRPRAPGIAASAGDPDHRPERFVGAAPATTTATTTAAATAAATAGTTTATATAAATAAATAGTTTATTPGEGGRGGRGRGGEAGAALDRARRGTVRDDRRRRRSRGPR